ncbi:hypothetical protein SLEP1_g13596 [Rubroshorea leprosula]|uniref:Pentatricopeptide repeat-containing protein n=1 Tax=Rubroshorea leprosula TaxID=152421 RepID=A0AAV5IM71_9ROSI|nr:hypothetical protein SLEP1_g13596 [Rubroshorea leprosula]
MHAKCGSIDNAEHAFSEIRERSMVSWSAMVGGLAQHGHGREAIVVQLDDRRWYISQSHITSVSVLSAYNHAGLVAAAKKYLESMKRSFRIEPLQEHYACMIDILGRAGRLDEAVELANKMPFQAKGPAWGGLLSATRIHKRMMRLGNKLLRCFWLLNLLKNLEPMLSLQTYIRRTWNTVSGDAFYAFSGEFNLILNLVLINLEKTPHCHGIVVSLSPYIDPGLFLYHG